MQHRWACFDCWCCFGITRITLNHSSWTFGDSTSESTISGVLLADVAFDIATSGCEVFVVIAMTGLGKA